jgi:hypothetical protein
VLNSVVKSECDRTLEEKTRWRVNCLPWLDSFLLRQAERSSRSFARPNTFALQTSLEKALYTTGVSDASVMPTATRKFIRLRKLTDKSTSLWSMPTLWVRDTAEFIPFFWTWFLMGQNFDLLARHVFVRIAFLWMCWQGTQLSKGTCRNFEEIPLTWLLTIRKSLPSVRQVQALGGAFGVKYPLPLQPPVNTTCYSMINSMFMSRQKRDC